ncbi:MAG: hypothetical protein RLZZ546_2670 [Bacteroidota bacterium]
MKTNLILNLFERDTTSGRVYLPFLDGLRFLAISAVFIQHVQNYFSHDLQLDFFSILIDKWRFGVELFFIISGFILCLPFAENHLNGKPKIHLKNYYLRRVTRIEPPYVINLIVYLIILLFLFNKNLIDLIPHFFASLFYVHNLIFKTGSEINPVCWSLEIEIQFYLFAPLFSRIFKIRNKLFRRVSFFLISIVSIIISKILAKYYITPINIFTYLPYFMVGFLLVDIWVAEWNSALPKSSLFFEILSIVGWILLPITFYWDFPFRVTLTSMYLFILLFSTFKGTLILKILNIRIIRIIGGMCYTIYMFHPLGIELISKYLPIFDSLVIYNSIFQSVIIFLFSLPIFMILFLFVEKPFMKLNITRR